MKKNPLSSVSVLHSTFKKNIDYVEISFVKTRLPAIGSQEFCCFLHFFSSNDLTSASFLFAIYPPPI